jgi:hypothetical protein
MSWKVQEFFRLWCIVNGDRNSEPENASAAGIAEQKDTDAGAVIDENIDSDKEKVQKKEEKEDRDMTKFSIELDFRV